MFAMADHYETQQMEVHRRISGETDPNDVGFWRRRLLAVREKNQQVAPAEEGNMPVGVAPNVEDQTIRPEVDPQEKRAQRW